MVLDHSINIGTGRPLPLESNRTYAIECGVPRSMAAHPIAVAVCVRVRRIVWTQDAALAVCPSFVAELRSSHAH